MGRVGSGAATPELLELGSGWLGLGEGHCGAVGVYVSRLCGGVGGDGCMRVPWQVSSNVVYRIPIAISSAAAERACEEVVTGMHVCGMWGWTRGTHYLPYCPQIFWAGVCSAGVVGGQDTQPRSTRTPSPAVAVVAGELLVLRVVARIYLGGGAGNADHSTTGQTDKLRGIPEGQQHRSGVATSHEHHVVAWG